MSRKLLRKQICPPPMVLKNFSKCISGRSKKFIFVPKYTFRRHKNCVFFRMRTYLVVMGVGIVSQWLPNVLLCKYGQGLCNNNFEDLFFLFVVFCFLFLSFSLNTSLILRNETQKISGICINFIQS